VNVSNMNKITYLLSIFSGFSSTEDRSKAAETTGFPFHSSFGDQ